MGENKPLPSRHSVETPSGRISYREQGTGPVALFVHGVLLNGHLWRHQLAELSDIRRCVSVDLLAHGDTGSRFRPARMCQFDRQCLAEMIRQFLDALKVDQVDLVGNDSEAVSPRSLPRSTRIECAVSPSPTATRTTIGRLRRSNLFWLSPPAEGCAGRLTPCCRTRASIDRRKLWARHTNTRND